MRHLSFLLLFFLPFLAYSQHSENLQSDRPGQSISPNTIGKRTLQIQAGYVHDNTEISGLGRHMPEKEVRTNNEDYGSLILRFGIFEKTEISAQTSLGFENAHTSGENGYESKYDIADYGFGIRQNFLNETENGVSLGLNADFLIRNTGDNEIRFVAAASKQFFEKLSLTANLGYLIDNRMFYTLNAAYQVTDKLGAFVEYYPYYSENTNLSNEDCFKLRESSVNTGLYYQLSPNFMVDVAGFFQTYDDRENEGLEVSGFSFQLGFTSRMDWRK